MIKTGIVERVKQTQNKPELELLGFNSLREYPKFRDADFTQAKTFAPNYSEDSKVFYVIEKHNESELIAYERGVGYVKNEKGKSVLVRELPIAFGPSREDTRPANRFQDFTEGYKECVIAYSTFPSSALEALIFPHSVLNSADSHLQVTALPKDSFLGRRDGNIEAVTTDELQEWPSFISSIAKLITDYTRELKFKTVRATFTTVLSNLLRLAPSSRPNSAQVGSIIFNKDTGKFEGFNGTYWVTLGE